LSSSEQIRAHYDQLAASYDRERNQSFFARGLRHYRDAIRGVEAAGVLEVGCGTGAYLAALRSEGCDAYGVDFSPRMCEIARERLRALGLPADDIVRQADVAIDAGFEREFGAVVVMDCWECFRDPAAVLAVSRRRLAPGGRLVIFTPNPLFRWFLTALEVLRIKKLRPAFLYGNSAPHIVRRLAATAGFEVRERRTLFLGLEQRFVLCPTRA
jgi:SAM-dependent methyltransferase